MVLTMMLSMLGQGAVELKLNPPKNAVYRFAMTVNSTQKMGAQNMGMKLAADQTMKILSVGAGKIVMEFSVANAKVTVPAGSPMAGMKESMEKGMSMKGKLTMDSQGKTLSFDAGKGQAAAMAQSISNSTSGVVYPKGPVSVGKTWGSTVDYGKISQSAGMPMTGLIPVKMTLAEISSKNGLKAALIKYTMTGNLNMSMGNSKITTKLKASGYQWVEVATGMLIESSVTQNSTTAFGGQNMTQVVTTSIRRK